jgi:hypothetical protein
LMISGCCRGCGTYLHWFIFLITLNFTHLVWTISNRNSQMRWASSLISLIFRMRCLSSLHTQLHKRLVITTLSRLFSNSFGETQVSSSGRILAEGPKWQTREGGGESEWEPIKILFKNSA